MRDETKKIIDQTFAAIRIAIAKFDEIPIPQGETAVANHKATKNRLLRAVRHLNLMVETSHPDWKSKNELRRNRRANGVTSGRDSFNEYCNREMGLDENDWVLDEDWGNK